MNAKAQLVARGLSQRRGLHYHETFATSPTTLCIRLKGAIACELPLNLCHVDAQHVFVQAEPKDVVERHRAAERCLAQ